VLGDPRTNQNPAILSFGILFFRFHNVIAARVQRDNPDWPDEEVFQRARRFVVATFQVRKTKLFTNKIKNEPKHLIFAEYYLLRIPACLSGQKDAGVRGLQLGHPPWSEPRVPERRLQIRPHFDPTRNPQEKQQMRIQENVHGLRCHQTVLHLVGFKCNDYLNPSGDQFFTL